MPRSSFKSRPKSRKYRRTKRGNRRKKNKRKNHVTKRRRKQYGGLRSVPINHVYMIAREYIESDDIEHAMFLEDLHEINLTGLGIITPEDYIAYVMVGHDRLTVWRNLPDTNLNNVQDRKYNEAIGSLEGIEGI